MLPFRSCSFTIQITKSGTVLRSVSFFFPHLVFLKESQLADTFEQNSLPNPIEMKQFIILFVLSFFLFLNNISAQYGINGSYQTFSASGWEDLIQESGLEGAAPIESGFAIGIDRWFRLKEKRVEFFPELNYARYSVDWSDDITSLNHQQISLFANTHFYVFDFEGDCDCPTFSKDGNFFKKGFYLAVSPGLSYANYEFEESEGDPNNSSILPSIGLGIGVDFGLSDLVTVTPMIRYRRHFNAEWDDLAENLELNPSEVNISGEETGLNIFSFGIRLGIRLDE